MGPETAAAYKRLCNSFPVLVRTCGLCQALAFHKSKESKDEAHALLLQHVKKLLEDGELLKADSDPLDAVRTANTTQYMLHTRRILAAWIYFKRFAESILDVEDKHA